MVFLEAMEHLKVNVPVYRTGWVPQDGYIVLMQGMTHAWKIVLKPTPNAGNYVFSMEDFTRDDWEVFTNEMVEK